MYYATSFFDIDDEEWCDSSCEGHEAASPEDAVRATWGHCYLDDPATDRERLEEWFSGRTDTPEWHVIALDRTHWIVTFEIRPVAFEDGENGRRVRWEMHHVSTISAPHEHAAKYPARWRYVTSEEAKADVADGCNWMSEGWWIDHFCESGDCDDCKECMRDAP